MINSIGSMNSAMMMRTSSTQQHPPPPPGKDAFKVADSDGDGLVAGTELEAVVSGINEIVGADLGIEDAAAYDVDEDGGLNGEEMMNLLADNGFGPPQGIGGESGGPPPPPPPSMEQALSSYEENSGEDLISQLISNLQNSENESEEYTSVDTIS